MSRESSEHLLREEEKQWIKTDYIEHLSNARSSRVRDLIWIILNSALTTVVLILVLVVLGLRYLGDYQHHDTRSCQYYSPALEASKLGSRIKTIDQTTESPFNYGEPEHIDANWTSLLRIGMLSITEDELLRVGAPRDSVRLPGGGGYLAYLASHHHLHCLYLLYQSLHQDYYATRSVVWEMPADMRLSHWDHCIEELRQYVVCNADTTVVTHGWIDELPFPVPNAANPRLCADWDAHFKWQLGRQAKAPEVPLTKPADKGGEH